MHFRLHCLSVLRRWPKGSTWGLLYVRCNILWKFIATVIDGAEYRETVNLCIKHACWTSSQWPWIYLCSIQSLQCSEKWVIESWLTKQSIPINSTACTCFFSSYLRGYASESSLRLYASCAYNVCNPRDQKVYNTIQKFQLGLTLPPKITWVLPGLILQLNSNTVCVCFR